MLAYRYNIELTLGSITELAVDVIVNAANRTLLGGGGVDGAIHRAAGPELRRFCASLGGCATGEAKITPGFRLPARYIIHTPGPVYSRNPIVATLLRKCYQNCLDLALANNCKSIAFPCISTGAYGYPIQEATQIAIDTVVNYQEQNENIMEKVIFCCFSERDYGVYQTLLTNFQK